MKAIIALLTVCLAVTTWAAPSLPSQEQSFLNEVSAAQQRGMTWLIKQQEPDGSWRHHPAITALAVTSVLRAGRPLSPVEQAAADKAIQFIIANVRTNGAINAGDEKDMYPNYSTAICTMALLATGKSEYTDIIRNARKFLLNSQFDEGEGYTTNNASWGGIGYGKRERPDMSNMQWSLEALRLTESLEKPSEKAPHLPSKLHWDKALQFLQRCQNLPEKNDQPWVKVAKEEDRGGFIYMPGDPAKGIPPVSFANDGQPVDEKTPLRSYASMTYAGLKSYLYAELKKDDPRVAATLAWLKKNYSLDENPGMGKQGLFYYYHTVAKALTVFGADTFTDAAGKQHDWRFELMNKLIGLQKTDGFWINDNNRWWENDPVLVTSYSLLAMEILQARQYP
jgi:squalene-hopene/tetraprenyl-beta-curcumene cyclase